MTIDELWQAIRRAGKEHDYALNDTPRAPGAGLPSSVTVLEPADDGSGRWTVYFTERGLIFDPEYFDTEAQACEFVLERLHEAPPPAPRVATADEMAMARQRNAEIKAEARQTLIEAGYDPDTLESRQ